MAPRAIDKGYEGHNLCSHSIMASQESARRDWVQKKLRDDGTSCLNAVQVDHFVRAKTATSAIVMATDGLQFVNTETDGLTLSSRSESR